jgi:hypothetical protein
LTDFPDYFAFLDMSFEIDEDLLVTERDTYGILDFIGDVGGLTEFLYIFVGLFAYKFSRFKVEAELTKNLSFISGRDKKQIAKKIMTKSNKKIT